MALKGTLKDFSVADIFQLIGQQQKSGSLYVRTKVKEAQIVFDTGKVVLGTFKKSDEDFLLGTMLLRAGTITSEQLSQAMENQKTTLRSLGDILKSMKAVNSSLLADFVALQLKEVLFRLFQWNEGFYEFIPEKIQYNRTIIKPQSAEAVLMDGFRMLDEWPKIIEKVGSAESVFSSQDPDLSDSGTPETDTTEEQKKVLNAMDGIRSLQEIIYSSRLGTFETYRIAAELLDKGLIEKVSELAPTYLDAARHLKATKSIGGWVITSARTLVLIFIISLAFPVVAFGIRSHWSVSYGDPKKGINPSGPSSMEDLREIHERESIRIRLDLYRLQNGTYPASLEELQDSTLESRWGYSRYEDHYTLSPSLRAQ